MTCFLPQLLRRPCRRRSLVREAALGDTKSVPTKAALGEELGVGRSIIQAAAASGEEPGVRSCKFATELLTTFETNNTTQGLGESSGVRGTGSATRCVGTGMWLQEIIEPGAPCGGPAV